jgi:hypothetical protein
VCLLSSAGSVHLIKREDDVPDGRTAGLQTRVNVLTLLFYLRPHVSLADEVAGGIARYLGTDHQQMPATGSALSCTPHRCAAATDAA